MFYIYSVSAVERTFRKNTTSQGLTKYRTWTVFAKAFDNANVVFLLRAFRFVFRYKYQSLLRQNTFFFKGLSSIMQLFRLSVWNNVIAPANAPW